MRGTRASGNPESGRIVETKKLLTPRHAAGKDSCKYMYSRVKRKAGEDYPPESSSSCRLRVSFGPFVACVLSTG